MEIPSRLLQEILAGNCVLFIGAGVTSEANVGIPGGSKLVRIIARECKELDSSFSLAAHTDDALEDIAETFIGLHSTEAIGTRELKCLLAGEVPPRGERPLDPNTCSHALILDILELNRLIFTTNWDELLEEAIQRFTEVHNPNIVFEVSQLANAPIRVVKLHGTMSFPESVRITRKEVTDCYSGAATELWGRFISELTDGTVLFVGYALSDSDFKALSDAVEKATPGRQHFALQLHASASECAKWENKGIHIFKGRARDFFSKIYEETCRFVNRDPEVKLEMLKKHPYYQILGRAGIGKTELLNRIHSNVRVQQSIRKSVYKNACHYTFPRNDPYPADARISDFLQELSRQLGLAERDIKGEVTDIIKTLTAAGRTDVNWQAEFDRIAEDVAFGVADAIKSDSTLLTIDCQSKMNDRVVKILEAIVLPGMESRRKRSPHILVGSRYGLYWPSRHPKFKVKHDFKEYRLKPFVETDINDAVRYYSVLHANANLSPDDCAEIASLIHEITEGYPRCIKLVLQRLIRRGRSGLRHLTTVQTAKAYLKKQRRWLLRAIVNDVVMKEILDDLPTGTQKALRDSLCVARSLNKTLISMLVEGEDPDTIWEALEDNQLVQAQGKENYPIYRLDPPVRRMLARCLRETEKSRFMNLLEATYKYFWPLACSTREDLQRFYFREWLYHYTLAMSVTGAGDNPLGELTNKIEKITLHSQEARMASQLAAEVKDDGELRELIERLLSTDCETLFDSIKQLKIKEA